MWMTQSSHHMGVIWMTQTSSTGLVCLVGQLGQSNPSPPLVPMERGPLHTVRTFVAARRTVYLGAMVLLDGWLGLSPMPDSASEEPLQVPAQWIKGTLRLATGAKTLRQLLWGLSEEAGMEVG